MGGDAQEAPKGPRGNPASDGRSRGHHPELVLAAGDGEGAAFAGGGRTAGGALRGECRRGSVSIPCLNSRWEFPGRVRKVSAPRIRVVGLGGTVDLWPVGAAHQVVQADAEEVGQADEDLVGWPDVSVLVAADVGPGDFHGGSELFLRNFFGAPEVAQPFREIQKLRATP